MCVYSISYCGTHPGKHDEPVGVGRLPVLSLTLAGGLCKTLRVRAKGEGMKQSAKRGLLVNAIMRT